MVMLLEADICNERMLARRNTMLSSKHIVTLPPRYSTLANVTLEVLNSPIVFEYEVKLIGI